MAALVLVLVLVLVFVLAAVLVVPASLATATHSNSSVSSLIVAHGVPAFRFDGVGGLSGGGATSTFLMGYDPGARDEILDWMFKPGYAASLDILKVEVSAG